MVDDASTDGTVAYLESVAKKDSRVRFFQSRDNLGAASARNIAMSEAKGRFLAFLDSDDSWLPTKLENQIQFMRDGKAFSFTAYQLVDIEDNKLGRTVDSTNAESFGYEDILNKRATIGCSTVVIDRELVGYFEMPQMRTGQDYATWLSLLKQGHKAWLLRDILMNYRISPNSLSRNKFKKAARQWSIYRDQERLSVFRSLKHFSFYAYHALNRRP